MYDKNELPADKKATLIMHRWVIGLNCLELTIFLILLIVTIMKKRQTKLIILEVLMLLNSVCTIGFFVCENNEKYMQEVKNKPCPFVIIEFKIFFFSTKLVIEALSHWFYIWRYHIVSF